MSRLRFLIALICLSASTLAAAQDEQPFSSLEERMTGSEFTEAGLHKLSPEELAALNRWIRERSVAEYDGPGPGQGGASGSGQPASIDDMPREAFQSRISGSFTGWSGETTFELDNGMVWQQVGDDTFYVPVVENPTVTIRPGIMGSWRLSVEGFNSSTRVERIR